MAETVGERLATVETWRDGHEKLCAQRQEAMGREIKELKGSVDGLSKGAWAVALALLAFALTQLWDGVERTPAAAVAAVHANAR